MKKILATLMTFLLPIVICFTFTACSDTSQGNQGLDDGSDTGIKEPIAHYLENVQVSQSDIGAELKNMYKDASGNYYFDYYIGEISNSFIQTVMEPIKNIDGLESITYSRKEVTTSSIRNGITHTISTSKGIELYSEESDTVSWGIGASISATRGISVGISRGVSASASGSIKIAADYSKTHTTTNATTIINNVTETISKLYDTSNEVSDSNEVTTVYDTSKFEKGFYYAPCLFGTYDINQVIVYDSVKDEIAYTYFVGNIRATGIEMFSSESYEYEIPADCQLFPVTSIGKERLKNIINNGVVIQIENEEENIKEPIVVFEKQIRTNSEKIHSTHFATDTITIDEIISELQTKGYSKLIFTVNFQLKEVDNCKQYLTLYTPNNIVIEKCTYSHGGSKKNTNWGSYYFEKDISLAQLTSNIFYLKYSAESVAFKDWYIGTVNIRVLASV